jgi:hypothetical protein
MLRGAREVPTAGRTEQHWLAGYLCWLLHATRRCIVSQREVGDLRAASLPSSNSAVRVHVALQAAQRSAPKPPTPHAQLLVCKSPSRACDALHPRAMAQHLRSAHPRAPPAAPRPRLPAAPLPPPTLRHHTSTHTCRQTHTRTRARLRDLQAVCAVARRQLRQRRTRSATRVDGACDVRQG